MDSEFEDRLQKHREFHRKPKEAVGDWLYPGVDYLGGGWDEDHLLVHLQGDTGDTLEEIRAFYWSKICPGQPRVEGSTYFMGGKKPWFIFRSPQGAGNYTMIVHTDDERTITVVVGPAGTCGPAGCGIDERPDRRNVMITMEKHLSPEAQA